MQYFKYGSRVVENEQMVRFKNYFKNFGRALRAVVDFCVAICIFVALNSLLHSLAHHTGLFSFNSTMHVIQESAQLIATNDALSFVSFMYEHTICIVLYFAISCAFCIVYMIYAISGETQGVQNTISYVHGDFSQSTVSTNVAISYRHKVCFLA